MIAFLAVVGVLALVATLDATVRSYRLRRLQDRRPGWTICQFARSFPKDQRDPTVLRAVFNYFGMWLVRDPEGFPVHPDDGLFTHYEMWPEDLELEVPEIAALAGRSLLNSEANPYGDGVNTVRELVGYLLAQPRIDVA